RQRGVEAFERAVAARPADAVEKDVARSRDPDEVRRGEPPEHGDVAPRVEPFGRERAGKAAAEPLGDLLPARRGDEAEAGVFDVPGNAGEHAVELGQVFGQMLAAP